MRGRGLPRWWALLLEMLSMCTWYRPHVHAIAGCIGDGLGTCHLLIAQRGDLWFLHVSGSYWTMCRVPVVPHINFYWHTCHVAVGSRVTSSLDHVSYFYWSTWPFLIQPHVMVLFVHVLFFYSATWLDGFLPRVGFLLAHVSCHGYFTCHALVRPCVAFLFDHMAYSGSTTCTTINSS